MSDSDRGEMTTQVVLVVPVVALILMIAIQAAIYFHTSNVAGAAASQGAAAAVRKDSTTAATIAGREAAMALMSDAGVVLIETPEVTVNVQTISVVVRARVPSVVPYFPSVVLRSATEPREMFLTEAMR